MDTFGKRLRWARERKGLSQPQLEVISTVKQQMISKLERGESNYTKKFHELAAALDVSAAWLVTGVGPIDPRLANDAEFAEFMKTMAALTPLQVEMLVALAKTWFAKDRAQDAVIQLFPED